MDYQNQAGTNEMAIKKCYVWLWLILSIGSGLTSIFANKAMGQTLQINTHFSSIAGNPVWLLVIRDVDKGIVVPYIFDILDNDNYWLALSGSRNYVVTASTLKFGPFAKIHNFCHLENSLLKATSMMITLQGDLTPDTHTFKCRIIKYKDLS